MSHGPEWLIYLIPAVILLGTATAMIQAGHWVAGGLTGGLAVYVLYRGWRWNYG